MRRRDFVQSAALLSSLTYAATLLGASEPLPKPVSGPVVRSPLRLVVLDWGLAETLLAMGIAPIGIAEIEGYHDNVVEPPVPDGVQDVGLRLAPSLEVIQQLAPDLILVNSSQESQRAMLERIAPVRAFAIYTDAGMPYRHALGTTLQLGRLCGDEARARELIDQSAGVLRQSHAVLAASKARQGARPRPLYLIRFFDVRHIGVFGARSLFQDVMDALGVVNAWQGPTDYWGIGVAGLEKLAASPDAGVLYFEPLPAGVAEHLDTNRLWHALPAVSAGRVDSLPSFWGFGMLPSAARFARELTSALVRSGNLA